MLPISNNPFIQQKYKKEKYEFGNMLLEGIANYKVNPQFFIPTENFPAPPQPLKESHSITHQKDVFTPMKNILNNKRTHGGMEPSQKKQKLIPPPLDLTMRDLNTEIQFSQISPKGVDAIQTPNRNSEILQWTLEEDEEFLNIIRTTKIENGMRWKNVAEAFKKRNADQCKGRFQRHWSRLIAFEQLQKAANVIKVYINEHNQRDFYISPIGMDSWDEELAADAWDFFSDLT